MNYSTPIVPIRKKSNFLRQCLPPLLSALLVVLPVLGDDALPLAADPSAAAQAPGAQTPATPAPPANPAPPQASGGAPAQPQAPAPLPTEESLKVIVLAGRDEENDIQRKVMAPLVVEILDQNDRPVEGAEVVFRFPLEGASAVFAGGRSSQTVRTNGQGEAAAMNWMANSQAGRFQVHVNASYGNQLGQATFYMINGTKPARPNATVLGPGSERRGSWYSPTWVKIAVIGGAAALVTGIILATRGGGSSKSSGSTITISPGAPSIGGPH